MASSHAAALSCARGTGTPSGAPVAGSRRFGVNRDGGVARASAFATGGDRSAVRAQLRGRISHPVRTNGRGVMPVEAKHSAVPEAKVRAIFRVSLFVTLDSANEL